jgi:plasmid stability protein
LIPTAIVAMVVSPVFDAARGRLRRERRRERYLHAVILCYCASVRNITVSVPDDVYRSARIKAAERGSSVSAIVTEYLRSLSGGDAEFARREAQQRDIQRQIKRFSAVDRLGRDEVHDRAVR